MGKQGSADKTIRKIRRKARRKFSAEEKIRIVIEGLRGEKSVSSLRRREGIAANLYYRWSEDLTEARAPAGAWANALTNAVRPPKRAARNRPNESSTPQLLDRCLQGV